MTSFGGADELQRHLMTAHAQTIYRCSLCLEVFGSQEDIQVHFLLKHSNQCDVFGCSKCDVIFG